MRRFLTKHDPEHQPPSSPRVEVTHHHHAKSSFATGFGLMLGCLTAIVIFFFGGCGIFLGLLGIGTNAAIEEAERVRREQEQRDRIVAISRDRGEASTPDQTEHEKAVAASRKEMQRLSEEQAKKRAADWAELKERRQRNWELDEADRQVKRDAEIALQKAAEDAKFRTFTSADGKFTVEAKIVSYAQGKVTLEGRTGTRSAVDESRLSEEDREYIRQWRNAKKNR